MDNPKYTIFIIDDDTFILNMYSIKFTKDGFNVVACSNAQDALDKIKSGVVPDIILLDLVMPGMDGLDFLKILRQNMLAVSSIVIILSNQSESTDIDKAQKLKIDGYIVKATTIPSEVVAMVKEAYEKTHHG